MQSTTNRRLMIPSRKHMVTTTTFTRGRKRQVYHYGDMRKEPYEGNFSQVHQVQFHHNGLCTQKCNKVGHFAHDCRSFGNTNVANTQKGNGENPKGNGCFECGAPRHFKRDCPKLKNKDGGNGSAQGWCSWECREVRECIGKPGLQCRYGYVPLKQPLCIYLIRHWCR
ncbi:putative reverse transcriptase domain-containing protein [Tanacetum coccineum]